MLEHTLLPKTIALPVFSSDPLSSNAYATEEILAVLLTASATSAHLVMPIAIPIALLMVIVITSYRQTVHAYPSGGGAYIVSKENLGTVPGLVAAASLLIDYVLTVSVSVTAGVVAITSALPSLREQAVPLAMVSVLLLTLANLRGVKEAGSVFAVPTYAFVASVLVMIGLGLFRCLSGCPVAEPLEPAQHLATAAGPISLFVILHAFSSGSTALTGVEAISNGVPAFRRPQADNAARTLAVMGAMTVTMFLGISYLATHIGGITVSHERSVIGQVAHAVFGGGIGFYVIQAFTAAILILAANTAYQDFPRLASILARDRFMPSQFRNRGDRLVFSNGVIVLAVFAAVLIWLFDADLSRLIQLYVVGVFTSFTLSQSGMVRHWLAERTRSEAGAKGWRRAIVINGVGAVTTGVVLVVITSTKFLHGAWIVILAMPFIVVGLLGIHRHYEHVARSLRSTHLRPETERLEPLRVPRPRSRSCDDRRPRVPARAAAPGHRRRVRREPSRFDETARAWLGLAPRFGPLQPLPADSKGPIRGVRRFLRTIDREGIDFVTVVVPESVSGVSWLALATRQRPAFLLKASLLFTPDVVVTNVPLVPEEVEEAERRAFRPTEPARHVVLVPISAVHDGTVQAIVYAKTLHATHVGGAVHRRRPRGHAGHRGSLVGFRDRHPPVARRGAVPGVRAAAPRGGPHAHGSHGHDRHRGAAGAPRHPLVGAPPARPDRAVLQTDPAGRTARGGDERPLPAPEALGTEGCQPCRRLGPPRHEAFDDAGAEPIARFDREACRHHVCAWTSRELVAVP